MDNFLPELFELVVKNATEGFAPPFAAMAQRVPQITQHNFGRVERNFICSQY